MSVTVAIETPNQPEVLGLIEASDVYMNALYPPEGNFAVDIDALCKPDIAFVVARLHGKAAGCGAIKWHEDGTAELKRIFVAGDARGNGIGRRIMDQLQDLADGNVTALIVLDDVRVDDVVRVRYSIVGSNPILSGQLIDATTFAWSSPMLRTRLRVLYDPGRKPDVRLENGAPTPAANAMQLPRSRPRSFGSRP